MVQVVQVDQAEVVQIIIIPVAQEMMVKEGQVPVVETVEEELVQLVAHAHGWPM